MLDLIYTDADGAEVGVLGGYALTMTYGSAENTFEAVFASASAPALGKGCMIYAEGTEYGGIVGGEKSSTTDATTTFYGPTWHGVLNERVIRPPQGKTHFEYDGDANGLLRAIVSHLGLSRWFSVEPSAAGRRVTCKVRFERAYDAIAAVLAASSMRLAISWRRDHAMLSAVETLQWSNANSSNAEFEVDRLLRAPNHMLLLGKGEMLDRTVVDIYLDELGNVSREQSIFGLDEVTVIYEDPSAEEEELVERGTESLLGMQQPDAVDVSSEIVDDCAVGDFVTVANLEASQVATAPVTSKTVTILNGVATFSCDLGDVTSSASGSGGSSGSGKASGYVYRAGDGIVIEGATINAEVTGDEFMDLAGIVEGKADARHKHLKSDITDFEHGHDWDDISGTPSAYPPEEHTHLKSDITDFEHTHGWDAIEGKPDAFPPSGHDHDGRYYTESEVDEKLGQKADADHRHDASDIDGLPSGGDGITGIVPIESGGTNATTAAEARANLDAAARIHTHDSLYNADNRSVATTPGDYENRLMWHGLKQNSVIGNPVSGGYSFLMGLRGWKDTSAGGSWEMAFNNSGVYSRFGTTAWGAWRRLRDANGVTPVESGGTAAENVHDAAHNLQVQSMSVGAEIPAGSDLNGYTAVGTYVCGYTANVAGMANKPSSLTTAFRLDVYRLISNTSGTNANHRLQVITEWTAGRMWFRQISNANTTSAAYGAWRMMRFAEDTIPVSGGGTGGTTSAAARANLAVPACASANGYYGIMRPDGNISDWLRSPQSGFLPYASGGGSSSLGTTSWPWNNVWCQTVNCKGNGNFDGSVVSKGTITAYNGATYRAQLGGGSGYLWLDCQSTSGTMVNNLVLYPDRTETNALGAVIGSPWDTSNIRKFARKDDYLEVTTKNYGVKGVTWWSSDERIKHDIDDSDVDALSVIGSIPHRSFVMEQTGVGYQVGYVAQELEAIDPNMVVKVPQYRQVGDVQVWTGDYAYQVDERTMLPYATKAIQELSQKVESQQSEIDELKARVADLMALVGKGA